jgi:uncharacterized protein YecE (DUF72 family)
MLEGVATAIRIGTCSWADEARSKYWYPKGTPPAERLPYYAEHFDTVEIDSTFYRLPNPEHVEKWSSWTPDGFVFHFKAFAPITRHPVKPDALPEELREGLEVDERGRIEYLPRDVRGEVVRLFREALEPAAEAGKLGGILVQLAPYVVFKPQSFEYLEWLRAQLPDDDLLVEFRHRSWLDDENRAETLAFLERHALTTVVVDAPRSEAKNLIPTVVAVTSPTSYVRFHGRNAKTWNVRGGSAADRFDYLYSPAELEEWVEPMRELAGQAENVYAVFNTNRWSPDPRGGPDDLVSQGAHNATELRNVLQEAGVAAS